jgi:uncharacterized protein (TIGR02301 family)
MIPRIVLVLSLLSPFTAEPAVAASSKAADQKAPAPAPPAIEPAAPYDDVLLRLSEVLGSVSYLRSICAPKEPQDWRQAMQKLLDSETRDEPERKARLTAAFNRGYRSFASVYTDCTAQAIAAESQYRNEGATLAAEITARFGN